MDKLTLPEEYVFYACTPQNGIIVTAETIDVGIAQKEEERTKTIICKAKVGPEVEKTPALIAFLGQINMQCSYDSEADANLVFIILSNMVQFLAEEDDLIFYIGVRAYVERKLPYHQETVERWEKFRDNNRHTPVEELLNDWMEGYERALPSKDRDRALEYGRMVRVFIDYTDSDK